MSAIIQSILAFLAIFAAIFGAMWLMNRAWKHPEECNSGCSDCPLKEGCSKPEKQSDVQEVASNAAEDDEQDRVEAEDECAQENATE